MQILCLAGWQQKPDALAGIAPDGLHFDYASYSDTETMFRGLPAAPDLAIGWSLGGQLLVRATAGGYIKPQKLLLLAAPFQFIADESFAAGMSQVDFNGVRNNYRKHPHKMLAQFQNLVGLGEDRDTRSIRILSDVTQLWNQGVFWLDELANATCHDMDFSDFPETVIVHGQSDKVIPPANAEALAARLPGSQLFLLPGCSHAVHLHEANFLRNLLQDHV